MLKLLILSLSFSVFALSEAKEWELLYNYNKSIKTDYNQTNLADTVPSARPGGNPEVDNLERFFGSDSLSISESGIKRKISRSPAFPKPARNFKAKKRSR